MEWYLILTITLASTSNFGAGCGGADCGLYSISEPIYLKMPSQEICEQVAAAQDDYEAACWAKPANKPEVKE